MLDIPSVIGWIIILGAGVAWEIKGLINEKRGDTLSELVWRITRPAWILRYGLAGILIWVVVHFFTLGAWA